MAALNYRVFTPALIVLAFVGTWLVPERCDAQAVPQLPANMAYDVVPYYSIQVQYYATTWDQGQECLVWIVVAETESYERAMALYEKLLIANELGILNDVVPYEGYYWSYYAVDVRMVTKWRLVRR